MNWATRVRSNLQRHVPPNMQGAQGRLVSCGAALSGANVQHLIAAIWQKQSTTSVCTHRTSRKFELQLSELSQVVVALFGDARSALEGTKETCPTSSSSRESMTSQLVMSSGIPLTPPTATTLGSSQPSLSLNPILVFSSPNCPDLDDRHPMAPNVILARAFCSSAPAELRILVLTQTT